jgi:AraC-like DNA-binding protein/mannose-6-phosphate isomerase-like protein (cupin superfamily)
MRGSREQIQLPSGHSFRVLRWTGSLRQVDVLFAPGAAASASGAGEHWHYHPEMELTLFSSGEGTRFVGDDIAAFGPGDLVLLGSRLPHYWHAVGASSGLSLQWDFPPAHPFWAFPENLALAPLFKAAARGLRYTGRTAAAASSLLREITRTSGVDQFGLLLRAFAVLAGAPDRDHRALSRRAFSLTAASAHQQAIAGAMAHLVANFREPIRLEALLRITGMSKPTFSRQFKKHSGKTFSDFVTSLRLQAARRELEQSERSILEIAFSCGFPQVAFFNRVFRRTQGCNPTQYRRRLSRRGHNSTIVVDSDLQL